MNLIVLVSGVIVLNIYSTTSDEQCTVRTIYGQLLGKQMTSRNGRVFCGFLGIPYAAPPIGKLRFLPPISPQLWEGKRNCTEEGSVCLQKKLKGSEDCLYLNVFTHKYESNESYTVMVYIHGGSFRFGSSSLSFFGPEFLMEKDIVLVTLQYRLGAFGFLSTEDKVVPGNMGLKDQVKALQWVQENIQFFGGDPKKVTIFGNSAGGASVHLHMQSPLSKKLFVRGISQSGTALSSFAITSKGKSRKDTEDLAISLNCSMENSIEILICLQNKSSLTILDAFNKQLTSKYGDNKIFRPVIEVDTNHAFLTASPWVVTTDKPWLVGVNANEGIYKIIEEQINQTLQFIHSEFYNFGPHYMFIYDLYFNLEEIANLTHDFYFKNASSTNEMIRSLEQLVSDSRIVWPTEQAIRQHNGTLYYYLYEHRGENSFTDRHSCLKGFGVSHTDELFSLFPQKIFSELNEQDTNISKFMVNCWVNFATEGNPTPHSISSNPQRKDTTRCIWEASNSTDPMYLHIQTNKLSMKKKMFSNRMDFWRKLPLRHKMHT